MICSILHYSIDGFSNICIFVQENSIKMSSTTLTHQDIGQRIAQLRSLKGLTQEEFAKNLSMSRSSLAQLELGKRKLDAVELVLIMQLFGLSADAFLFDAFDNIKGSKISTSHQRLESEERMEMRISSPHFQLVKMRNVLLYLASKTAGKPEVDERFLQLLLYFTDFDHYERYETQVTGAKYIKMSTGPSAVEFQAVLSALLADKSLLRITTEATKGVRLKYIPLLEVDLTALSATEVDMMDSIAERFASWSYDKMKEYVKGDMPYMASDLETPIDYNLAFYREASYTTRKYN